MRFVTQKIIRAACRIKLGLQKQLMLGNLDAKRDWGHSSDYCQAMIMILEHDRPDDFVIATEDQYSVREFLNKIAEKLNFDLWEYVKINDRWKRPMEVPSLMGDSTKIRKVLGWSPEYDFDALVQEMVGEQMRLASNELKLKEKNNG